MPSPAWPIRSPASRGDVRGMNEAADADAGDQPAARRGACGAARDPGEPGLFGQRSSPRRRAARPDGGGRSPTIPPSLPTMASSRLGWATGRPQSPCSSAALAAQRASGQPAPESWHQRALALAVDGRLGPQSAALGRELVAAYPSAGNWRDALLALRVGEPPRPAGTAAAPPPADPALDLDIRRLRRAAGALAGERDYLEFAQALSRARLAGRGQGGARRRRQPPACSTPMRRSSASN